MLVLGGVMLPPVLHAQGNLHVYFVDVEGGQATLFVTPAGRSLLIDAGWPGNDARDAKRIAAAVKRAGIATIDYALITHFHTDHVGGVAQLAARVPITTFIDHGENRETTDTLTVQGWHTYQELLSTGRYKHIVAKPGDVLPVPGMRATVVSADGATIAAPLNAGGRDNPACSNSPAYQPDQSENRRTVGTVIEFGQLRLLDLGDLTRDEEMNLMCPINKLGTFDIYIVSHHGWEQSSSPALVYGITPRVAIMDNGAQKGGSPSVWDVISRSPGLESLWQLHYSEPGGAAHNVSSEYIANPSGLDEGHYLELVGRGDGSFDIYNSRTRRTTAYPRLSRREAGVPARRPLGLFGAHDDVGRPSTIGPGSAAYDASTGRYTITGGGANMWATSDHFHYVWTKVTGDVALEAAVEFTASAPQSGSPDPHRKACLVIRQTLDPDSPYIDAATHGDGLTSLQWRDGKGAVTHEVQSGAVRPTRMRIEKRGDYASMWVAADGEPLHPAGGAARVHLTGEYYVGLAVSAHDTARLETATFSRVAIEAPAPLGTAATLVNTLETISLRSGDRRVAYVVTQPQRIEAPNWFPDQTNTLYFNTRGRLFKIQAELPGAVRNLLHFNTPQPVDLGILTNLNNDHGLSPDGTTWALSDQSQLLDGQHPSLIYTMPVGGGAATRVTDRGPSYFHGWSPDGKTIAFCGLRDGNFDIFTVPAAGGAERRLTSNPGKDDGPEFSPDGRYIYFNSDRSGTMQIWRMSPDGSGQEQITNDEWDNWFPHVSPDGGRLAFLSYERGVGDHPENKNVRLRVMMLANRAVDELAKLFGGQGTINVASWSPNSQYLAFVSYQIVPQ